MKDVQKIKEFFSNPVKESTSLDDEAKVYWMQQLKKGKIDTLPEDPKAAYMKIKIKKSLKEESDLFKINTDLAFKIFDFLKTKLGEEFTSEFPIKSNFFFQLNDYLKGINEAMTTAYEAKEEDPVDTITMDIPLFLRMLEYSREDASEDMDLHDVTEKANKLGKERGILQMDDYDEIVDEEKDALKEFLTSPEWNKMSKEDRIKLLQKYFPKLSLKFADWKWDDLTPMIKNKLIGKKDNLKETILNVLKSKKISPKK